MTLARAARCAAVLLATALLAGCTAMAETPGVSKIALAGGGVEITAAPLPEAAFAACSDKIAADKAAKAAKIAAANRKARAAKAAAIAAANRKAQVAKAARRKSATKRRQRVRIVYPPPLVFPPWMFP